MPKHTLMERLKLTKSPKKSKKKISFDKRKFNEALERFRGSKSKRKKPKFNLD